MHLTKLSAWLRLHRVMLCVAAAALAAVLLVIWGNRSLGVIQTAPLAAAAIDAQDATAAQPTLAPNGGNAADMPRNLSRDQQLAILRERLTLAEHTLNNYRAATAYPRFSRPIQEHPDQIYPNRPIEAEHPLRKTDGSIDAAVTVKTTQSRVFVGAQESVEFSIAASDKQGAKLPIFVTRAVAKGIVLTGQRPSAQWTLDFADAGQNGDALAGDGVFSAQLTPSATGFSQFSGTIRTEVSFTVGDKNAFVSFDIVYTPSLPATWTGEVRDALDAGSLSFYLKTNVQQAGRYLITARLDDALGKPFALLNFNDELPAGPQEVKLLVFGKLLHDYAPAFPLTLRDVDGYLLMVGSDPDRAMMPRRIGRVHTSKKYALTSFSNAEASSDDRTRYLVELNADVLRAKVALDALQGGQ